MIARMLSRWAAETFQTLGNPHYRVLWIGTTISFLVFGMMNIVQSVVAYDLTGRNGAVGAVALGMGVSTICIAPFGGVIADRVSKRRLLLIGQSLIAITFLAVGALIVADRIFLGALIAATFVLGAVFSFIAPARQAWIGELLTRDEIGNGVALQQVSMTATRVAGPFAAGGFIAIAFIGTGGTYLIMGALIVIVVATLAQLPPTTSRVTRDGPGVVADLREGMDHMVERPRLLLLALSFIAIVVFGYTHQVILPGYIENELERDADSVLAWFFGVSAIAGLAVTIGIARYANGPLAWKLMCAGGALLGAGLLLTAVAPGLPHALAAMLLVGAGSGAFQMLNNALVMHESDPAYYGRVMSLTMLAWGFNGLAGFPFGLLADGIGERHTLLIMGACVLGVTAATIAASRNLRRQPPARLTPIPDATAGG